MRNGSGPEKEKVTATLATRLKKWTNENPTSPGGNSRLGRASCCLIFLSLFHHAEDWRVARNFNFIPAIGDRPGIR